MERTIPCLNCSASNPSFGKFCIKCGLSLRHAAATVGGAAAQVAPAAATSLQKEGPNGVGGWLALFCATLIAFNPLLSLKNFFELMEVANDLEKIRPGLLTLAVIESLVALAMLLWGMCVGIQLVRIRSGAPRAAKTYLLAFLVFNVVDALGPPLLFQIAPDTAVAKELVRSIVYFSVWYSYLSVSTRVKATFISVSE
jgi:hypothetical protein